MHTEATLDPLDTYARQALDQITTSSLCILWHATVRDPGDGELIWKTQVANEAAAQQYLPLKIVEGERYAQAWYISRPPEDRTRIDTISTEALLSGASGYRQDYRCVRQDGELRWLSEEVQITRLTPGLWHVIGVCVDVTERKCIEQDPAPRDQRDQNSTLMGVVELLADNVLHLLDSRQETRSLCGASKAPRSRRTTDLENSHEYVKMWINQFRQAEITSETVFFEHEHQTPAGTRWFGVVICRLPSFGSGRPRFFYQATDITERKQNLYFPEVAVLYLSEASDQLTNLATSDGLTGLDNDRSFQRKLAEQFAWARHSGAPLSLALFEVDYFKQYTDHFGHPAGDEVLKQIAGLTAITARESDVAARYGGEEFAVILPTTDVEGSLVFAKRLRQIVADHSWAHRNVTITVGVITLRDDHDSPSRLIEEADAALYLANALGRNRVLHHQFIAEEYAGRSIGWEV